MPTGRRTMGIGRGGHGVVEGMGEGTDRINGAPHLQGVTAVVGQGQIHRGSRAVGGRRGRILTGWSPETGHLLTHSLPGGANSLRIQAPLPAGLGGGVGHHEALHGHRPPGIKDGQPPAGLALPQEALGPQQPLHHPLAQAERTRLVSIGRPQGGVGMGFEAVQERGEGHQGIPPLDNRDWTPGAKRHGLRGGAPTLDPP